MQFIDTHAHIYSTKYDSDRDEVIARCIDYGVNKIYMPNIDVESIDPMLEAELKYPEVCIPMMGLHPCDVTKGFEQQLYVMEDWINKRPFVAVGEIGLDLYWDKTYYDQQKEALKIQISWAREKQLPIILHCRASLPETIALVKEELDENLTGIFHCFSGSEEQAREIIEMGFLLGIGGVATFKNGGMDKVLPKIGINHLVLETDGPFLAPVPHRGKRNSPEYIPIIAEKISELTDTSLENVAEVTNNNAARIFSYLKR
ncbi:TatD family hydrolase [Anditalea andensis]|uniref:Hydrolase TatD n=1 Tax=Anditalea andensis TaxID=1048983 RepID=A0A074KS25_9BACT|nr:TatD family hydrolase [Anditalea andensis]KEO72761.1 hydrolase TatD [Anditalea andensis]